MNEEVNFSEEQSFKSTTVIGQPKTPAMVKFLVKTGITRSETTAGYMLLVGSVIILVVAIFIFINIYKEPEITPLTPEQMEQLPDYLKPAQ